MEKKWEMWTTFGQMEVLVGLGILLMDLHMDRFGQMGGFEEMPLYMDF